MKTRTLLLLVSAFVFAGSAAASLPVATASLGASSEATSSVTPLTRDLILSSLSRDLTSHYDLDGNLELELLRSWTPPAQVASRWSIDIADYPAVASSSMVIRCRVSADGVALAEPTFILHAMLWRDVWVTRLPLTTGSTFDPAVLDTRRVDMFRDRDALPAAVGDRSYIFACSIPAGRLLTWRDIARRPLVKRGAMVDVSAVDGTLVITMRGEAMENGGRGDMVTVRNPTTRKDFAATVVDENHVQVRF